MNNDDFDTRNLQHSTKTYIICIDLKIYTDLILIEDSKPIKCYN